MSKKNLIINLTNNQDVFEIDESFFEQKALDITQKIIESDILQKSSLVQYDFENNDIEIDILICDNEQIHQINKEYRGKDSPTDIITFALFADEEPEDRMIFGNQIHLGEIMISTEKIDAQSKEYNKSFEDELYFILAHGILHLFGFTHEDDEKLEFMIKTQENLIV